MTTPDALEQRLAGLIVPAPDPGRITAHVLSMSVTRPRRHFARVAALAVAVLVIALGALYFVPATDAALADTPIAGDLLRDAGLVGAYADSTRTVLILHAEPAIWLSASNPELKDQFGRTYMMRSGMGNALTGNLVLQFEALSWPDSITGARIILHMTALAPIACVAAPSANSEGVICSNPGPPVVGSWTLPATIGVDEGTVLALPAPARLGSANFRFTSVVATPATIGVEIDVTGMSFADLYKIIPDGRKGTPAFSTDLIGPDGVTKVAGGGGSSGDDLTGTHIHIQLRWNRDGSAAGDYRLRIAYIGLGEFERVLHIP